MGKFIDLSGQRFGKLIVIERNYSKKIKNKKNRTYWLCLCDCGNKTIIDGSHLKSGNTKSCGCLLLETCIKNLPVNKYENLSKMVFTRLIAIKRVDGKTKKHSYWLCECECGNEIIVRANDLKRGIIKSCGCLSRDMLIERNTKKYGEATFNTLYGIYVGSARHKKLDFQIDKEYFRLITKQNCYYCGCEPSKIKKSKSNNGDYIYNGIDRIDSQLGYIPNNCVPCCENCNYAKLRMKEQEFYNWIQRVYDNLIQTNKISL